MTFADISVSCLWLVGDGCLFLFWSTEDFDAYGVTNSVVGDELPEVLIPPTPLGRDILVELYAIPLVESGVRISLGE